jgi:hypothetical protein
MSTTHTPLMAGANAVISGQRTQSPRTEGLISRARPKRDGPSADDLRAHLRAWDTSVSHRIQDNTSPVCATSLGSAARPPFASQPFAWRGICQRLLLMDICCIGAGYVGGPTMAIIASRCPDVPVTAFAFDGRNILPQEVMRAIGFEVHAIGKPVRLEGDSVGTESICRVQAA